jgi:hypothetical protein
MDSAGRLIGEVFVKAVDRGVDSGGGSLQMGVLAAFGQAMFQVAQFDDQAFDDRFQSALMVGLASGGDGGGVHR